MKGRIKNTVIVIGGSHHNMLGIIRALGMKGCKIIAIITNDKPYSFVSKSRFIEKSFLINQDEEQALKLLDKLSQELSDKGIIIPTSDFAALLIDNNLDRLKPNYVVPSINCNQGEIAKYMDKYEQFLLSEKYGVRMAKCNIIDLDNYRDNGKFKKCIIKPLVSANGKKSDIAICDSKEVFSKTLRLLHDKGYEKVLVQDYIDFDRECGLIGCAKDGEVILPGIIKKNRIYPLKRGSNSYSDVEMLDQSNGEIAKIINILKELKYDGLFDIEIFLKGDTVYLNEINFRNSGNTFAYCFDDVYIAYLWALMAFGKDISNNKKEITKNFSYIDEKLEMKQLFDKNITISDYFKTRRKAKARLLHFRKDIKPSVYKIIYAIRNRITR